jgi:hypothetical protein
MITIFTGDFLKKNGAKSAQTQLPIEPEEPHVTPNLLIDLFLTNYFLF